MFGTTSRRTVLNVFRPRLRRTFADDALKTSPSVPQSAGKSQEIAGFFSRIKSFALGAGLTALATQYYIFQEINNGNMIMMKKQIDIEARLKNLEK
mmetsp:Transcript_37016/g.41346  ORF Transcript_37016/g.41346 Transcript_37016/m.41346 type:complete len:96 (-) Transcript_37016:1328-1615(-)